MDLNNIDLPPSVIASLYRSSLVEIPGATTNIQPILSEPENNESSSLPVSSVNKWLGENRKNILVIVDHPDLVHVPDNELILLTGMLTACQLGLADTAIVNRAHYMSLTYKEMTSQFKSKVVLLFGVEPADFGLPMNFPHFQLQAFSNNTFLSSPSLKELEADKLLKSKLWVCLKRLFGV